MPLHSSKGFGSRSSSSSSSSKKSAPPSASKAAAQRGALKEPVGIKDAILNHCPSFNLSHPGVRVLHDDPPVIEIENFFDAKTCDEYISNAERVGVNIGQSKTFANAGSVRTSTTWYMRYRDVLEFIRGINKVTGCAIETYEEPQIVRYETGQQFSYHLDAIPKSMLDGSGQRVATVICYLNDVALGGCTVFKDLKLQVKPVKGKALVFFPAYHSGAPDDRTEHCGQVAFDTKYIAQLWIHQRAYSPVVVQGNSQQEAIELMQRK